jgi:hypothetical protein
MAGSSKRLSRRKEARAELERLFDHPDNLNIIHYSCESFYDRVDGTSPRITSIAVRHVGSRQTTSFSIHQVAELRGVTADQMEGVYDELERTMLNDFYKHVRQHAGRHWIHWNMRDANYGFQAIAHRHRVLGGCPVDLAEDHLYDLASKLIDIYGRSYAQNPRLERLMEINRISRNNFLSGAEEARAFERKDYVKLHQSTLRKVDVIHSFAEKELDRTLRTNASLADQLGFSPPAWVDWLSENWIVRLLAAVGIVFTIISFIIQIWPKGN